MDKLFASEGMFNLLWMQRAQLYFKSKFNYHRFGYNISSFTCIEFYLSLDTLWTCFLGSPVTLWVTETHRTNGSTIITQLDNVDNFKIDFWNSELSPAQHTYIKEKICLSIFFSLLGIEASYNIASQNESDKKEIKYQEQIKMVA